MAQIKRHAGDTMSDAVVGDVEVLGHFTGLNFPTLLGLPPSRLAETSHMQIDQNIASPSTLSHC